MRPTNEALKKWHEAMLAMQSLCKNVDLKNVCKLLEGIIAGAFNNPLLHMIVIDGVSHIAHVPSGGSGLSWKFLDNPLENASKKGDLRLRLEASGILIAERNGGPRQKSDLERTISEQCDYAGREMERTLDYCGHMAQEFSTLLHMTIPSHGSMLEWQRIASYDPSDEFETLQINERMDDSWFDMPTFNMALKISKEARAIRKVMKM